MLISFTILFLFGCTPKLKVITYSDGTQYETGVKKLIDGGETEGEGQLLLVEAVLRCIEGEDCLGEDYWIILTYYGKFPLMDGKEVKAIADSKEIDIIDDPYFTNELGEEWWEEYELPYSKDDFRILANAQKVEIQIGDRKLEVRQSNRILWKKLLDPFAEE
jgi:hypothetical protein